MSALEELINDYERRTFANITGVLVAEARTELGAKDAALAAAREVLQNVIDNCHECENGFCSYDYGLGPVLKPCPDCTKARESLAALPGVRTEAKP